MKILFCAMPVHYLNQSKSMNTAPNTALYYLSSILREQGNDVTILDPSELLRSVSNENQMKDFLMKQTINNEIVCFTSNTLNWALTKLATTIIKKELGNKIKVILGGIHPSYFQREIMESCDVDYILRGEGDKTLSLLIKAIESGDEPENISGLAWRKGSKCVINQVYETVHIEDYKNFALANYDAMPEDTYTIFPIETSRGCRFACDFCSIPHKNNWKPFPADIVIQRANFLLKKYKKKFITNQVFLTDDCFTFDIERALYIVNGISIENPEVEFIIEARATDILLQDSEKVLELYKKGTIIRLATGVECGYNEGLKRIHKGLTIEQLENMMQFLAENNIIHKAFYSFIIGFPWESLDDCIKTIDYAASIVRRFGNGMVNINWLWLLPSKIWEERKKYGIDVEADIFDKLNYGMGYEMFEITHPNISMGTMKYVTSIIEEYAEEGISLNSQ